jgi:hypothetical protein
MSAVNNGPVITKNGLILGLDASSRGSYLPNSLINMDSWTVSNGSVTGYNQNGQTAENQRSAAANPWGQTGVIWGSFPLGENNDDGGWNTTNFNIDNTKLYRFSVWVKRTSSTSGGTFYFGMYAGGDGSRRMDNSAVEGNAYWSCIGTGGLTQDVWYLFVGHVYPYNTTYTGRHPDTGYYFVNNPVKQGDVNGCNIGTGDLKWSSNSTTGVHRTYHYYCVDNTTRLQFYDPRVDLVNGKQPSINELVARSPVQWKDLSGIGNSFIANNAPAYSSNFFTLNGTTQFFSISAASGFFISSTNNFYADAGYAWTISVWFKFPVSPTSLRDATINGGNCSYCIFGNGGGIGGAETLALFVSGVSGTSAGFHPYYCVVGLRGGKTQLSLGSVNTNTWNNVIITWNGSAGRGYFNGVDRGALNNALQGMQVSGYTIGATAGGASAHLFEGNISLARVYNRALTATEVSQNYEAVKSRFGL